MVGFTDVYWYCFQLRHTIPFCIGNHCFANTKNKFKNFQNYINYPLCMFYPSLLCECNSVKITKKIISMIVKAMRHIYYVLYVCGSFQIALVNNFLKLGLNEVKLRFRERLTKNLYDQYLQWVQEQCQRCSSVTYDFLEFIYLSSIEHFKNKSVKHMKHYHSIQLAAFWFSFSKLNFFEIYKQFQTWFLHSSGKSELLIK